MFPRAEEVWLSQRPGSKGDGTSACVSLRILLMEWMEGSIRIKEEKLYLQENARKRKTNNDDQNLILSLFLTAKF